MSPEDHPTARPPVPDYTLLHLIGRGSYGDVWIARGVTGMLRAVKVVWRDRFSDIEPYEREFRGLSDFIRLTQGEARQLALLHVGRNEEAGFFFYVMELADDVVTGREIDPGCYAPLTLSVLRDQSAYVTTADVVRYAIELAAGLAELHRAGLVHRDIKPSNVILVDGRPKLADIGLVSVATEAMSFVGTQGFVPPEGPGTRAADIFSLGKVLYELVTGLDRQDFPSLPIDIADRPDRVEMLELNESIIKACAPLASGRFPDAEALLHELKLLEAGRSVRRLRFAERGLARTRRWVVVAVIVALIAGTGAAWERRRANIKSAGRQAAEAELAAVTRRTLYEASLAAAQRALETANYGIARNALERAIPTPGDPDLRGFEWHAFYREAQGDPAEIIRESGEPVTRLEPSPDGRWMAVDNASPVIDLFDQKTGKHFKAIEGIHRIAGFTPDGERLVGTTPDYALETWSINDGSPDPIPAKTGVNRPLQVHPSEPHILYFEDGPDDEPHTLGIWNYATGETVVAWPIPKIEDTGMSVFMNASATTDLTKALLVTTSNLSGARPMLLRIFDMSTGRIIEQEHSDTSITPAQISQAGDFYLARTRTLKRVEIGQPDLPPLVMPFEPFSSISLHANGRELLMGASNNRLVLANAKTGERIREFSGSSAQIDAVAYGSDYDALWSVDRNGEIRRWARETGPIRRVKTKLAMPAESRTTQLIISEDSSQIALRNTSGGLTVLGLENLELQWTHPDIAAVLWFDQERLILLSKAGELWEHAPSDGARGVRLDILDPGVRVRSALTSPDGRLMLVLSEGNHIVVWNNQTGSVIADYSGDRLDRQIGEFLSLAISNEGRVLSCDTRQTVLLWEASTGKVLASKKVPSQPARVQLSPRGDMAVIGVSADPPLLVSLPDLTEIGTISEGRRTGIDFVFHPSGDIVVTQLMRGSLSVIDPTNGNRMATLELPTSPESDLSGLVSRIVFSPDGKVLATCDHNGQLRVWRK